MFQVCCLLSALVSVSHGFAPLRPASTVTTTQLGMATMPPLSRRDVLKNAGSAAAASCILLNPTPAQALFDAGITAQSQQNKANESYQGVFVDPRHPDGYRVLKAEGCKGK